MNKETRTTVLSIIGIALLAGFGGFLMHSWVTAASVFGVLVVAAAVAGDVKLPKFLSKS